jgi:hypothetical protein
MMGNYEKSIPLARTYIYGTSSDRFRAFGGWKLGFALWMTGRKSEIRPIYESVVNTWSKVIEKRVCMFFFFLFFNLKRKRMSNHTIDIALESAKNFLIATTHSLKLTSFCFHQFGLQVLKGKRGWFFGLTNEPQRVETVGIDSFQSQSCQKADGEEGVWREGICA